MLKKFKFVCGDTSPQIGLTLTREDSGEPIDLTGATVNFHVKAIGATDVTLTKQCVITDAAAGQCTVAWTTGDLNLPEGEYNAEVEVVTDTYRETVFELIRLQLRDDIA